MAQSRLERVASIFDRITKLYQAQNLPLSELPMWHKIYETFPPKYNPHYNRKYEKKEIRTIFYEEDIIRAKFQKLHKEGSYTSLLNDSPSRTQKFLTTYKNTQKESIPEDETFEQAVRVYKQFSTFDKQRQSTIQPSNRRENNLQRKKNDKPDINYDVLFEDKE